MELKCNKLAEYVQEEGEFYCAKFEFEVPFGTLILDNESSNLEGVSADNCQFFTIVSRYVVDRTVGTDETVQRK